MRPPEHRVDRRSPAAGEPDSAPRLLEHVIVLALLCGICVVVWALNGGGRFWPAAVLLLAGVAIALEIAARLERWPRSVDDLKRQLRASRRD
jgi:hypothetical protein